VTTQCHGFSDGDNEEDDEDDDDDCAASLAGTRPRSMPRPLLLDHAQRSMTAGRLAVVNSLRSTVAGMEQTAAVAKTGRNGRNGTPTKTQPYR